MRTKRLGVVVILALALSGVRADEKSREMKPYQGSAEFERIKSLAGKWRGKMGQMDMELEYIVVAGGSAVMERTFPGTEMEMVTLYHDKEGKLALTHFCMLHNRPHLLLTGSDKNSISLQLDKDGEVDAEKDSHMHAVVLTFHGEDEIEQLWTHYVDGEPQEPHPMKFTRVKDAKAGAADKSKGGKS
ncbi:MAG: hypothetical protein ACR2RV_14510 [Verrucomicrobiales bacterium]